MSMMYLNTNNADACSYAQDSLMTGCLLIVADLKVQLYGRPNCKIPGESRLLDSFLPPIFEKNRPFYRGEMNMPGSSAQQDNEHQTNLMGRPDVRLKHIELFRTCDGFLLLNSYLKARLPFSSTGKPNAFPSPEALFNILFALYESLLSPSSAFSSPTDAASQLSQQKEDDAFSICQTLMQYFQHLSDDALKTAHPILLNGALKCLRMILDRLVDTRRAVCIEFYSIWRSLIHTLLFSSAHSLQMTGWEQVHAMIQACIHHRPPPRQYVVSNAGIAYVNGTYDYVGPTTPDGYVPVDADASYVRIIPADVPKLGGRKLTLFRCTMRNMSQWWFISIADEEQPGSDRDLDFYYHRSPTVTKIPPTDGWIALNSGTTQGTVPPRLQAIGIQMPPGQEHATFEHQMAAWVLKYNIVERVLKNTTIHAEVQAQLHPLIQFLFDLSARDADFSVFGLIPSLCEGSRQRRALKKRALLPPNISEGFKAKKALPLAIDSEPSAKSTPKHAAMEVALCVSKKAKMEVPECQRHRRTQDKAELRSFIEKLSNRKLQLLREYRDADDDFLKNEIKS
jgi:hypothetical protein